MTAFLLFVAIAWSVMAAGRQGLVWLRLTHEASPLERGLVSFALGIGALAYGMLLLGLVGLLYPAAAVCWVAALAGIGARQHRPMAAEWAACVRRRSEQPLWLHTTVGLLFAAFAFVSLAGVYCPPVVFLPGVDYTEWDSLSYHLADPQLYVRAHRIYYLPWESHSNFQFTAEMWYTLGLLLHSLPLAKWFHFACGVGSGLAVYALGARLLTPRIGLAAALLFVSTPLVFWEAGTAYSDLAATFFTTVTLLIVALGMAARDERRLWIGAILMGLTLSTKATALITLALAAAGLLWWRWRVSGQPLGTAIPRVVVWCIVAIVVGSPWYIKSAVYTHNPVYPFYYQIFGGKNWDKADAVAYDQSNEAFGMGRKPVDALLAPWNVTMYPLPGHPTLSLPFNNFPSPLVALSPLLLATLFFPVFFFGAPAPVKALGVYALASAAVWFLTMQYLRYLLPLVPVLCLLSAWVVVTSVTRRWISGYALALLYSASLAFSLFTGGRLAVQQAPVALGLASRTEYLTRGFAGYPAMQLLNSLPSPAKIVFYGFPFGFYCDKPYLWGDPNHSTVIPYASFHGPDDLRRYLVGMGVTHLLVDDGGYPPAADTANYVYALAAECGDPIYTRGHIHIWALPSEKR